MQYNRIMRKICGFLSGLDIWIRFLPFLALYTAVVLIFKPEGFFGDEARYLKLAYNLISGFYSPGGHDLYLRCGPGYPLFLAPFLLLKLPLTAIRLANAFLLYFALIAGYGAMKFYVSEKTSWRLSVLLGIYFPVFASLPYILTECLAWFLISLAGFLFAWSFNQRVPGIWGMVFLSMCLSWLAMTRVVFGYGIGVMAVILLFINLAGGHEKYRAGFFVFLLAFLMCMPYLVYTWRLTGRFFYWADNGGLSLYTMSTPHKGEFGDWRSLDELLDDPEHRDFIARVMEMDPLGRDMALRKKAVENIRKYPGKYLYNWTANIARMLFSFPFQGQESSRALFTIIPNMLLLPFLVLCLATALLNIRKLPREMVLLLLFILIYLFASSLLSAYRRMFYITVPFWFLFISCIFGRIIRIRIKK